MTTPRSVEAPAKLNLSLEVTGRRADGYHELRSRLVLLELADRLLLLPGCAGLRIEGPAAGGLPLGSDNLAWRGLAAGLGGEPDLACLALDKRIPAAAGLGGGSSDAAAAWRLGRAWRGLDDRPDGPQLADLASIGADVPFFAAQVAAAEVTGIGERVSEIPASEAEVVLVHPAFGLSTAAVFAELRRDEWGRLENDLLAPARRLRPELDAIMGVMAAAGTAPRLSGSGPTLFVLTDDADRADALARRLTAAGLAVTRTRTRTRPPDIHAIEEDSE